MKPVVWRQDFEKVIHSFIVTRCSTLYTRVEPGFALLFAARLLIGADTVTASTFLLFWTSSNGSLCTLEYISISLFVYKSLNGFAPRYRCNVLQPCVSLRSLRSKTRLKLRGDRAFAAIAPKL